MTDAPKESETDAEEEQYDERYDEHLENIDDGAGCTEIWEHLSENRGTDA